MLELYINRTTVWSNIDSVYTSEIHYVKDVILCSLTFVTFFLRKKIKDALIRPIDA